MRNAKCTVFSPKPPEEWDVYGKQENHLANFFAIKNLENKFPKFCIFLFSEFELIYLTATQAESGESSHLFAKQKVQIAQRIAFTTYDNTMAGYTSTPTCHDEIPDSETKSQARGPCSDLSRVLILSCF